MRRAACGGVGGGGGGVRRRGRGQEVLTDARYARFCAVLVGPRKAPGGGGGRRGATHIVVNGAVCPPRIVFHSQAQVRPCLCLCLYLSPRIVFHSQTQVINAAP
jgi:hypothetical protein